MSDKILMWCAVVWLVPLMTYLMIKTARFKNNIVAGVTFGEEGQSDTDVLTRLAKYKKDIKLTSLILFIAGIPGIFIPKMWIMLTYWLVWIDLPLFVYIIPFYLCNRDLKRIKREMYAGGRASYNSKDDDDKWLGGLIYYNSADSKLFVNDRTGTNTTVNLAKPVGKVLMGVYLISILLLPLISPAMHIYYEQTIEIKITKEEILASHGLTHYQIKLEDVEKAELINGLPADLKRINGTHFDDMLKGDFRSSKDNMKLILREDKRPFIKLTKKNGEVFVLGTDGDIKAKFEEIKENLR